ncbi:ABC transporter permease [Saccharolobus solfataricus]|uniref:ABC transporter, permease protein n=3 Tax=Saccharolobus solfataricus TaxID=2287 RepID=Q97VF6_SACS2|nr:ABC transporter permease [Saccharolobus solfataricus]AAK42788.1 ABC transporter, permease protein [Saccharolobus solfataricus P2]AKA72879.1 ABC transporter permease [Saccharolobus solfataricus]AKA75578.1 ABC transporter permease [Saccharolobus solfataricus]AKA78271.1 ABC transporter permease [Saccharolobus solfataricus]AZF67389.1 ABC transporter permease [Saccharolobus solfataricus]
MVQGKFFEYLRLLWDNKKSRVGLIITVFYILIAIFGQIIFPKTYSLPPSPTTIFMPPQLSNFYLIFGTGPFAESILVQIIQGAKSVIEISFLAGLFATLIGIVVGIIAGYLGGIIDNILMGITDIILTLPSLILIIIIVSAFKTSNPIFLSLILSITSWAGLARAVRSQVLVIRNSPAVEVLRVLGLSRKYIIFREVVPTLGSYIAIHYIFNVEAAVYAEVGLYYLGVLPYNPNNWGAMIQQALSYGAAAGGKAIYYLAFPTIVVAGFMSGLILLSYGIDEISNPRIRRY